MAITTLVEELVDDAVTTGFASAKGTDIFYNELPDTDLSPVTTIVLKETGGVVDNHTPAPWVAWQCLVKSVTDWETARIRAASFYQRYHEPTDLSTTSYRILMSQATALPQSIGQDERDRYQVSLNFLTRVVALDQGDGGEGGDDDRIIKKDPQVDDTPF